MGSLKGRVSTVIGLFSSICSRIFFEIEPFKTGKSLTQLTIDILDLAPHEKDKHGDSALILGFPS